MQIFDREAPFYDKVNFVDQNNVVLGYDSTQKCCESAGWIIHDAILVHPEGQGETIYSVEKPELLENLDPYTFDTSFFLEIDRDKFVQDLECGSCAVFKLVAADMPDLFLHLYNSHNGYYSHGFELKFNDQVLDEGWL